MLAKIVAAVLALVLAVGVLAMLRQDLVRALFKSKRHFVALEQDPRVLYEPGARDYAMAIATYLPTAIEKVETGHGLPFKEPFLVYVCATQEGFNEYIASPGSPVRGAALFGDVMIAPIAFSFHGHDTHQASLVHELSHLHLDQQLGYFGYRRRIPVWFSEGLANLVSGTGGEIVGQHEATEAILAGQHFVPDSKGSWPHVKRARDYGLHYPMLHQQSKLFVTYMRNTHEQAFESFLIDIQDGKGFALSFSEHFGVDVSTMWNNFADHLKVAKPDTSAQETQ
jgi:hypothetical protein